MFLYFSNWILFRYFLQLIWLKLKFILSFNLLRLSIAFNEFIWIAWWSSILLIKMILIIWLCFFFMIRIKWHFIWPVFIFLILIHCIFEFIIVAVWLDHSYCYYIRLMLISQLFNIPAYLILSLYGVFFVSIQFELLNFAWAIVKFLLIDIDISPASMLSVTLSIKFTSRYHLVILLIIQPHITFWMSLVRLGITITQFLPCKQINLLGILNVGVIFLILVCILLVSQHYLIII